MKLRYVSFVVFLLVSSTQARAQAPLAADVVMNKAYQKAVQTDKKILLIFHASWCGWCHKMDSSLNDATCKKYFDNNFVIEHLTVMESKGKENLENPGALALMNKYDGKEQGLPYWVILDKNGHLLFDSQKRVTNTDGTVKGANIGCPASADEVKIFISMLKEVTKITDAEITAVAKRFRMNEK